MTNTIKPALSAEEWETRTKVLPPGVLSAVFLSNPDAGAPHFGVRAHDTWRGERYTGAIIASPAAMLAAIALANDALPDADPRKITREKIDALRSALEAAYERTLDPETASREFLDALESYLPPG